MWPKTCWSTKVGIALPIVQAGMAGGITTPELVAAVSNAGGLGQIGAGYLSLEQLELAIEAVRKLTTKPFGVNLFVPEQIVVSKEEIQQANDWLAPIRQEVGVAEAAKWEPAPDQLFEAQVDCVIAKQVAVCSFTFGVPTPAMVARLQAAGTMVVGTATTVEEAKANEAVGVDAIVVQGSEAGGHRGSFLEDEKQGMIGTMALVPQVVDAVDLPIIAAGGIMNARGIVAALVLGASAVQMGTAFVTTKESGASDIHKQAILQAKEDETVVTSSFSGKAARGIRNTFIKEMAPYEGKLPPYPVQNTLTTHIRAAASKQENPAYMSLWCGQYPRGSQAVEAGQLVTVLQEAVEQVIEGIQKR